MNRFREMCRHSAGKAAVLFVALTLAVIIVHYLPDFDENALARSIRDKGMPGVALFIAVTAVGSALGFPRQGLSFAAGYAFGALYGVIFATLGTLLGCACSFFLVRRFGKPFLSLRFSKRMERVDAFVAGEPFSMTLTIRLLPFGNNALFNIVAGLSSIPPTGFLAGSLVGYIPQNLVFALLGSGMRVDPFWRVLVSAVLFVFALGIGLILYRRHKTDLPIAEKKPWETPGEKP